MAFRHRQCVTRFFVAALALAQASAGFSAITVTGINTRQAPGGGVLISYHLSENATAVSINLSNGSSLPGGTAKGVNEVTFTGNPAGLTATITATAPALSGAGGAVLVTPLTAPNAPSITGIDAFRRANSPMKDQFVVASGFSAAAKELYRIAGDGAILKTGDLKVLGGATHGSKASWPFGMAIAQGDPGDRVWIANRSGQRMTVVQSRDMTLVKDLDGRYNYTGMSVTPIADAFVPPDTKYNLFMGGNNTAAEIGGVWHYIYDLPAGTRSEDKNVANAGLADLAAYTTSVAVDETTRVMFQSHNWALGAAGSASQSLTKWTSVDAGATWQADVAWNTAVTSAINVADAMPRGLALDKGFDPNNLSASHVWVAVNGGASNINKLFKINAASGAVAGTIDLTAVDASGSAITLADKRGHFLAVDTAGNIALTVDSTAGAVGASHYGILAPNSDAPSSYATASFSVEPGLSATASATPPRVGNTGGAAVHLEVEVFSSAGIVADNVAVTTNLAALGGGAVTLTRQSLSADGKTAVFAADHAVPTSASLGPAALSFNVSARSGSVVATASVQVYQAWTPRWRASVDGAVTASLAGNGSMAYVGTSEGGVYAFNADTGAPVAEFGDNGRVSVGEPVKNGLSISNGRLYVPGTTRLFILNVGTGIATGSAALPRPSRAAPHPTDDTTVFVGAGDNKVYALNANTGAVKYASQDLGAPVNDPSVGLSGDGFDDILIVVAGTENIEGTGGKIVMLKAADLSQAFPALTDARGAVRGRPAFGSLIAGTNIVAVGGASGLWGINADSGEKLGGPNSWGTAGGTQNGNPFGTPAPVDADPVVIRTGAADARIIFATTGGDLYTLVAADGSKISFGGYPAGITTPPGTGGFAEGSGILMQDGNAPGTDTRRRVAYIGSGPGDQRFFGVDTMPDDSTYAASADKVWIFDPNDTAAFPGETPGAFSVRPALADNSIVTGSSAGRVYAFAPLVAPLPYVVSVTPANGAFNVPTSAGIVVRYSGALTEFSGDVKLLRDGAEVSGSVDYGPEGETSIGFTPAGPLAANASYTVVVKDVQSAAGAVLSVFTSTFFTGPKPVVPHDVNGDGVFNLDDVKEVLRVVGGLKSGSANAVTQGDVAASAGQLTMEDALALRKLLP